MFGRSLKVHLARFKANLYDARSQGQDDLVGHEQRYQSQGFIGSFRKGLPTVDGQVSADHYLTYHKALHTRDFSALQGIASGLADPLGVYYQEMSGPEASCWPIGRGPPALDSLEMVRDMEQLYGMALVRDVPFQDYPTNPIVRMLADHHHTTPQALYHSESPGSFISQLLLQQKYTPLVPRVEYMLTQESYDRVHSNRIDKPTSLFQTTPRYISTLRDLASYGYQDFPTQAYHDTTLYLAKTHPLAMINPYADKPYNGFLAFNVPFTLDLLNKVSCLALKSAWYHKWLVHRMLRPEEMACEVDRLYSKRVAEYVGQPRKELLTSSLLKLTYEKQGNVLLAQAFPEGCPQHPSYPAGHSTIAGACVTILKALTKWDYVLSNPVVASRDGSELVRLEDETGLLLGHELNKLGYNIGHARCAGGVHYHADNEGGMMLGESIALRLLEEVKMGLEEGKGVKGFRFRVRLFNGKVRVI
jgi:hypothetical protein